MIEPFQEVPSPQELMDKVNELIAEHNAVIEAMPGGLRYRMEKMQQRTSNQEPEPPTGT